MLGNLLILFIEKNFNFVVNNCLYYGFFLSLGQIPWQQLTLATSFSCLVAFNTDVCTSMKHKKIRDYA